MLPLSSGELVQMRDTLDVSLPGEAVISTPTNVSDGQGGNVQTFAASGTADARLSPLTGDESAQLEKLTVVASHVLTLPAATAINEANRVEFSGRTYEVTLVANRETWELGRRVYVSRIS